MTTSTVLTTRLQEDDLADLRRSGLSDETILSMGCATVDAETIRSRTGVKKVDVLGYTIPYPGIDDQTGRPYIRYRLRHPIEKMRYASGVGDDAQLYIPPALASLPAADLLVVTEGEKKAAKAVQEGIHCVAVQGVWSWADSGNRAIEKSEGESVTEETLPISALLDLAQRYRRVLVLGDSDLITNHQARKGLQSLVKALVHRGIRAVLAFCPPAMEQGSGRGRVKKQGLDDWLVANRPLAIRSILPLFYAGEIAWDGINDTYNAVAFTEIAKGKLAYSQGIWRFWNGSIWVHDDSNKRRAMVPDLAQMYRSVADRLSNLLGRVMPQSNEDDNKAWPAAFESWSSPVVGAIKVLVDAAKKIGNLRAIDPTLAIAQSYLRVPDDAWDRDPYLLAVRNGVVDLRSSELLPFSREQRITKWAGTAYDPSAKPELFLKFLEQVQPDPRDRDFLQRLAGYCATGLAREQKFFTFIGNGANGKGTFIGLVMDALGNYAVKGAISLLAEQSPDKPRNDLAALSGARFVSLSETPENLRLDEAMLKAITGQDVLSARFLNHEFFQFRPVFTPILDTNYLPSPRGAGEAIWRRLVVVEWPVTIPTEERDEHLREKLVQELPGILNWIVEGAKLYLESGLPTLPKMQQANQSLRRTRDTLGRWLEECIAHGPGFQAQSSILYQNFRSWNEAEGNTPVPSQIKFTQDLERRGFENKKKHGLMTWIGLKLREAETAAELCDDAPPESESTSTVTETGSEADATPPVPHSLPAAAPIVLLPGGCVAI